MMAVENLGGGGFVITGEHIPLARLLVLQSGLKLESKGLKLSRGRSILAILKAEFGWKGNREKLAGLLAAKIDETKARLASAE